MNEKRRAELDAYYTPKSIAIEMAAAILPKKCNRILDPMCGDGILLKTIREMYPTYDLEFVGFDIDAEAIQSCNEWATKKDVFEVRSIFDWPEGENFDCDIVIMNPCFHKAERSRAIERATSIFNKGIMYIPFDVSNPVLNVSTGYSRVSLREYSKLFLTEVFNCDIKYRQGTICWEK